MPRTRNKELTKLTKSNKKPKTRLIPIFKGNKRVGSIRAEFKGRSGLIVRSSNVPGFRTQTKDSPQRQLNKIKGNRTVKARKR